MEKRRANAIEAYARQGADEDKVLAAIDRRRQDDITVDDLLHLKGMLTAIKDGELTLEKAMQPYGTEVEQTGRVVASSLNEELQREAAEGAGGE